MVDDLFSLGPAIQSVPCVLRDLILTEGLLAAFASETARCRWVSHFITGGRLQ